MIRILKLRPALALLLILGASACRQPAEPGVTSHVRGTLSLSPEVDSSGDFSSFRLVVTQATEAGVDTLGTAVTDSSGHFAMDVTASQAGVYPLVIDRGDDPLAIAELVVVDGDTVSVSAVFPLNRRRVRIVSPENAAWAAYRNTKAQFNQRLLSLADGGQVADADLAQSIAQTSAILWSLRDVYPGTIGSQLAEAEAIVMLDGWNDSLLVARFANIPAGHRNLIQMSRAARRATARLAGQDSAIAMMDRRIGASSGVMAAGLLSEVVMAHIDSGETEAALRAARALFEGGESGEWAEWGRRAQYELLNLMPGMAAPRIRAVDVAGDSVDTGDYLGRYLLLEFYEPSNPVFQRELPVRAALLASVDPAMLEVISLSVEPDSVLNEGLLDGRTFGGNFVFLPEGLAADATIAFNVNVVPTRVLIDPSGDIVGKYAGAAMENVAAVILQRLPNPDPLTNQSGN